MVSWRLLLGAHIAILLAVLCATLAPLLQRVWRLTLMPVSVADKSPQAVRIGLLGASFIGQVAMVYAAGKSKEAQIIAVASRDHKRAHDFAWRNGISVALGGPTAYEELLQRDDIEAVYISVPTRLHYQWAMAALEHGKHVLLEKPMTLNAAEAARLQAKAGTRGLTLMEAAHYRFHPAARRFRDMLAGSGVGSLERIEAEFHMLDPKAWFSNFIGTQRSGSDHERVKNLDRWWYCVDELLWFTNATSAEVIMAKEGRFSLTAELRLHVGDSRASASGTNSTVLATARMSRDRIWPPFAWNVHAFGSSGGSKFTNVGFPFLWHRIQSWGGEVTQVSDTMYGEGETTFEHQLSAFVAAVKSPSTTLEIPVGTMSVVDLLLAAAGSRPFETPST